MGKVIHIEEKTSRKNNNVVYNTKGGFLVGQAFITFLGNSRGIPANTGITMGPTYDNLALLSAIIAMQQFLIKDNNE